MRLAILSDVHANYYALKRAVDHAQDNHVTGYLFLGDLVGYGSMPLESFELMESLNIEPHHWLVGNHDLMANGEATLQLNWVTIDAQLTLKWSLQQEATATEQNWAIYQRFQDKTKTCPTFAASPHIAGLWLMHGGSVEDDTTVRNKSNNVFGENYIGNELSDHISERLEQSYQFACRQSDKPPHVMVGGHSHIASLWKRLATGCWEKSSIREIAQANRKPWAECPKCQGQGSCSFWRATNPISLGWETVYINPGSVGQSRDGCPAVSMAIWDVTQNSIQFWRLNYDYQDSCNDLPRMIDYENPRTYPQMEKVVNRLEHCLKNGAYQNIEVK